MVKLAKRTIGNLIAAYDTIARSAVLPTLIRNTFPIGFGKGRKRENSGSVPECRNVVGPLQVDLVPHMRNAQAVQDDGQHLRRFDRIIRLDPAKFHAAPDVFHIPAAPKERAGTFASPEPYECRLGPTTQIDFRPHTSFPVFRSRYDADFSF